MSTLAAEKHRAESDPILASSPVTNVSNSTLENPFKIFDQFPEIIHAQAARVAGRVNASGISEAEHNGLLSERQQLLDKQFSKTISSKEMNRLAYVRWSLDRIEDAKCGHALDFLEGSVSRYESLLSDLQKLGEQLQHHQVPPRKKR